MRFVAIDGTGGSGKSTVAKALAARLGWERLDTGAMYRAVALLALRHGIDPEDESGLAALARQMDLVVGEPTLLEGEDVSASIRSEAVNAVVSLVAAHPAVRAELVARQRAWAAQRAEGIIEGRDIGSVVLPDAGLKVYLDAHPEVRAARRAGEQAPLAAGEGVAEEGLAVTAASIAARDRLDSTRAVSPLVVAEGALVIDSTDLSVDQVTERLLAAARERGLTASGVTTEGSAGVDPDAGTRAEQALPTPPPDTARSGVTVPPSGDPGVPVVRPISRAELAFYAVCRAIAVGASRLLLPGPVLGGERLPREGAYVLAPSHRSYVDWLVAARVTRRRLRYLVKSEVWRSRAAGRLLELLGAFPVHRGTADRQAFNLALEVLAAGEPLVIFPEGTRTRGPKIEEIQEGAAYLALRAGVPVYPVGLGGTERSMPRGARLPRPTRVRIVVGPPIFPDEQLGEASRAGGTPVPTRGRVPRAATRAFSGKIRSGLQDVLDEAEGRPPGASS